MRCAGARKTISRSHLVALPDALAAVLALHLQTCSGCRREEQIDKSLDTDLAALPGTLEPPLFEVEVTARVLEMIHNSPARAHWLAEWGSRPALISATAMLAALVTLSLGSLSSVPAGLGQVRELGAPLSVLPSVAQALGKAALGVLTPLFDALGGLGPPLARVASDLAPVAETTFLLMIITACAGLTAVIGKELLFAPARHLPKE